MSVTSQGVRTFFSGYNVNATHFVYDSNAGTSLTSGSQQCKGDELVVQIGVPELEATSLTYRIEGKFPSSTRWAEIYTEKITSITTIDKLINVTERIMDMRVGVKVVKNTATANTIYASVNVTDYK